MLANKSFVLGEVLRYKQLIIKRKHLDDYFFVEILINVN